MTHDVNHEKKQMSFWKILFAISLIHWIASIAIPTALGIGFVDCIEKLESDTWVDGYCLKYEEVSPFEFAMISWRWTAQFTWLAPIYMYSEMNKKPDPQRKIDDYA